MQIIQLPFIFFLLMFKFFFLIFVLQQLILKQPNLAVWFVQFTPELLNLAFLESDQFIHSPFLSH